MITKKNVLLAAAIAGLVAGTSVARADDQPVDATPKKEEAAAPAKAKRATRAKARVKAHAKGHAKTETKKSENSCDGANGCDGSHHEGAAGDSHK